MTLIPKGQRKYPYNTGLFLGLETDIVVTNENSEPVDATSFFNKTNVVKVERKGGGENVASGTTNSFKINENGMVTLYTQPSYCRAYTIDNVWFVLKQLLLLLKKRAFISFVPSMSLSNKETVAGGCLFFQVSNCIYSQNGDVIKLNNMTSEQNNESHKRLKNNMRLVVGLLSMLLDRRETAELRRSLYGPGTSLEFKIYNKQLTYQTPTNFWMFSPILAHMMLGAARMAYFITINNIEEEIWEGFEPNDVINTIKNNDYMAAKEIWDFVKVRLGDSSGYRSADNPFLASRSMLLDFIIEYGVSVIGNGVYNNWHLKRKQSNYGGHLNELPSWEVGSSFKVFSVEHPMYNEWKKFEERIKENYAKK